MFGNAIHSPEDRRFVGQADGVVDDILVREPAHATRIGDHRFDSRLPDLTVDGVGEYVRLLRRHSSFLGAVDERAMSRFAATDLQILRAGVSRRIFEMEKVQPHLWNPLVWNPADALFTLVARDFATPQQRARSLVGRLGMVPAFLDNARHTLQEMPRVHVETAIAQLRQVEPMFAQSLGPLASEPGLADAIDVAVLAIDEHTDWLRSRLPVSNRNPALGATLFAGVLEHMLETGLSAEEVQAQAYADLDRVSEELSSLSAKYLGRSMADPGVSARALEALAIKSDISDDNVLDACTEALELAANFISERGLVTVPQIEARIETMTGIHRGIAVAYCDAPGPLERAEIPTVIGISPTPKSWSPQRRDSFYREYNQYLLHDLMAHEGLPGHLLQSAWANRALAPTSVRAAMPNELFVEGWAVYAEELMARSGFMVDAEHRQSFRIVQLKMQLRTILNTILDVGVHSQGMTEPEARRLLSTRGLQEDGEISAKWRRARLTYGQLSTYYLGYRGVADLVRDLGVRHGSWDQRQVHDTVLAHGSVSPLHLRALTGLE